MAFNFSPKIVTDGLVLALDAANPKSYVSGSTSWRDLSGTTVTGSLINGTGFDSANGGSLLFDGINDYVALQAVNLSSTNKITISFFCRLLSYTEVPGSTKIILEVSTNFNNTTTGLYIGYAEDSSPADYFSTFPISISLKGDVGYNIAGFNKNLVNDLKWHHWTCVFDKSQSGAAPQETFLYIDGVYQTASILPPARRLDNTNNFGNDIINIGGFRPTSSLPSNILLSNLQIYNRALSATEVLQNYNALKGRFGLT